MRRFALASLLVVAACPNPQPTPDGGTGGGGGNGQAPSITSLAPTHGPKGGGTVVTVNGLNLDPSVQVFFAAAQASDLTWVSRSQVRAKAPASPVTGYVSVRVQNPDGQSATLADSFLYDADTSGTIADARVLNPASASDSSGGATVSVNVLSEIEVTGVTTGAGAGAGIAAQVGFATTLSSPPSATDFTWVDAAYLKDADGPNAGDLAYDQYQGAVQLPGAQGAQVLTYYLAARYSIDNRATWTLADLDGSGNGFTSAQVPVFTVSQPIVDWCKLGGELPQPPDNLSLKAGQTGPTIYSQVYKKNVTDQSGAGAGITAQLGYGAVGSDPATWTWANASYNKDTGSGANDEWQAGLPVPAPGSYEFAYRYAYNQGPYLYCDADGSATGGFTHDQAGKLTVTPVGIDGCVLQFPSTLDARTTLKSGLVYGRVYSQGVTDSAGAGAGITAQLGYGPAGSQPSAGGWTWTTATFNVDAPNGQDEYQAAITPPAAGTFDYAYRFAYQGGTYAYCDLDGLANGYDPAQAGKMTVKTLGIDSCTVVTASGAGIPGGQTSAYLGKAFGVGVTDATGAGAGVTAELGYGPVGSQPSAAGWTWSSATYDSDQDNGASDQYSAKITAPAQGSYDVAYRFKYQNGAYVYCDLDGSANGYQTAQASKLSVGAPVIASCKLTGVTPSPTTSGAATTATAVVYVPGVTDAVGQGAGVKAQVGVGTQGDDASTSSKWGWQNAAYSKDGASGDDEYTVTFTPAYTGTRAVSFRFSVDNGASWKYCDTQGNATYDPAAQWNLLVGTMTGIDFCNLQFPSTASSGATVYGRIFQNGVTANAGADPSITAQLGYGKKDEDPGVAWTWSAATYNVQVGNDDEYQAALPSGLPSGTYHYAFRFQLSGGAWCFGDLDGDGANSVGQSWQGFQGDTSSGVNVGVLTVP